MMKIRYGILSILSMLFVILINSTMVSQVMASEITLPQEYYFVINGQNRKAGTEYELKQPEALLSVTAGTWEPETEVQWVSSQPNVIDIETTSYGSNFIKLIRKGPGFSTITAVIKQGKNTYSLSCHIKVDLSLDYQKTGLIISKTTEERILVLDELGETKQVYIKYVDYEEGTEVVSGSAISNTAVLWESEDEGVVTVDQRGRVKAIGAGSTNVKITTNTLSSQDRALSISLRVVVSPKFTLSYDDAQGNHHVVQSQPTANTDVVALGVPPNFVIESNSTLAPNLKWEVYDFSTKKKINPTGSNKMTYSISTLSGNVSFSNVKAGTYEIYAFADQKYNANTNAPYAYMKIVVPIDIRDTNVLMNVGDTYDIANNSNIPGVGIFEYYYELGNENIARLNKTTGIITARREGQVRLRLEYKTSQNLYDNFINVEDIYITINVIDGISLSTTSATLYTRGTLLLNALVTNPTEPITWTSSDPKIATVEDGLVTGIKEGVAIITASQTVKGVVKKATCEITVQQSVATITIDPAKVTLPIAGYKTLHASIKPKNLSGVVLQWKSSDEKVVKIVESSALTATIQGVSGGNAVISAINQDNVVVGYAHIVVQQPVTSIVLSETNINVDLKTKRLQIRATVYPENAQNKKIRWKSTDTSKARVDDNGIVTLLKPGAVSIIATSDDNPNVTAICNIDIQVPVTSIALDESKKTMYVGQQERLSYVVLPLDASNKAVTWTSTHPNIVSVDSTGRVTAKSVGTAVIILRSLDGGFSKYCTIEVKRVATGVKFDVTKLELEAGEYYYIKATATPNDSTDKELIWESSDTKVAIVDDNGKVTAKSAGTATIMARTEAGGIAFCKVTVTQPVTGILLNFSEKTIYIGEEFKLKVSVSPSEASKLGVTWKSSNTKVATVNDEGVVEGLLGGTALITCTTVDGGFVATCMVTVLEPVTTVTLDHDELYVGVNKSVTLKATVTSDTASNKKLKWVSSNPKVAVVNQNGKVTGKSVGYATIRAIAQDGSEVEDSCEIRVVKPITNMTLDKNFITMFVGDSRSLKVTIKPKDATIKEVKWTSSDPSIAIVDEDGVVTGLKAGRITITAEAMDNSGKKVICVVDVRDRVPATSVTLADRNIVMVPGETRTVQVVLNPTNSTDNFTWSTDNAAIASVNRTSGKITAKAPGTAMITVMTDSGKTATINVTVVGLNITEFTSEQYERHVGLLKVEGTNTRPQWSSQNTAIARVDANGTVSTYATGTTTITATVNGRKLTCKITVTKIR